MPSVRTSFLERKRPGHARIRELCDVAEQANHWANGGPVSRLLEEGIARATGLHSDRAVVACSSGTAALNALAGLHAERAGRPLRWAVSAYGFFSTFIGPFTDSLVVDCDGSGMLDLDLLAKAPADSYDGVCVTNLFGLHPHFDAYREFCGSRKKPLIIDNACGFFHVDRSRGDTPDEIISLHHTKPWGFGEGGCLIVAKEDETAARAMINFGVSLGKAAAPFAFNGKLSDVAAAFAIDRLEQIPEWAPLYGGQWRRITDLVAQAGLALTPLAPPAAATSGLGHIPFRATRPIDAAHLENEHFAIRKYYHPPHTPGIPVAEALYAHIVNVPCHREMAGVPDDAILAVLSELAQS